MTNLERATSLDLFPVVFKTTTERNVTECGSHWIYMQEGGHEQNKFGQVIIYVSAFRWPPAHYCMLQRRQNLKIACFSAIEESYIT